MNSREYNQKYDHEVYKRKLSKVLNKARMNNSLDDATPAKERLKKRRPTPYRSTASTSKLSTSNLNGNVQRLFSPNESDSEDSSRHSEKQNREIDSPRISHTSNNLNNSVPPKKSLRLAPLPKAKEKSIKRRSTPYHSTNKKVKHSETSKDVLFLSNNFDTESEEEAEDIDTYSAQSHKIFSVSTSECPKRDKVKHLSNIPKHKKKSTKNVKTSTKNMHENEGYLEAAGNNAIYDKRCFLIDQASDSESSNSLELDVTPDPSCTNTSVVVDDIYLSNDNDVETCDEEENADISDSQLDYSDEDVEDDKSGSIENNADLVEEIVGQAEYYPVKDVLVIVLHNNSKLYFHGLISVTMLQGAIEVLGYTLTPSSDCAEEFSPRGSSFLYLETKEEERSSSFTQEDLITALNNIGMENEISNKLCQDLEPSSAVLLCKRIIDPKITFLEKHTSQLLFPSSEKPGPRCDFKNIISTENVFKPGIKWDSLASSIDSASKLFICGGKSVGKSTMLRYFINKLLMKHPEILVIDLDPGQPEFTVPGCISEITVREPIFGPNYTHLRKPSRCLFIANVDIAYAPNDYIANVKELIHSCSSLRKIPTIINYMGFIRGLALEIFSAVVAYVQPTCLIQIKSSSRKQNFKKELTYELICDRSKLFASTVDFVPAFPIHTIESMADTKQGWHSTPRQIRDMCLLSYLSQMLPKDVFSLTDSKVPVYVINLSLIKIVCNGEIVSPSVVNANLVALCSRTSDPAYTCHGWGVVRGINLTANELFLLTPVLPDELEQVDHLILGSVSLPPSLYMTADNNIGLVPFVSQGVLTTLAKIPKRSHLPPKNKQDRKVKN